MKLGFFTMPIHPLDKDWRQSLREDREAFLLADELGFVEGYVGEHATDRAENITSSAVFIASLIDATKSIKLGTGTINMPNAHPAATASQIAMLDHMLDGRFIFGISPGGLLSDAEAFGNLDADRNAMFVEAIDAVLKIWASEPPYNIQGKYWTIRIEQQAMLEIGQGFLPKPLQQPHPPIVVTAVAPFSKGVTEAAARGWDPISANFLMPKWGQEPLAKICRGLRPRRPQGRSGELARRQIDLRRRRRPNREGLCHRSERPVPLLLQPALHQAQARPSRPVQDPPGPARQRGDARRHLRRAHHPRLAGQGRRRDPEIPRARRRFRHAPLCRQGLARSSARQTLDDFAGGEGAAQGQRGDRSVIAPYSSSHARGGGGEQSEPAEDYLIACGLIGEPVPPVMTSGAPQKKNS